MGGLDAAEHMGLGPWPLCGPACVGVQIVRRSAEKGAMLIRPGSLLRDLFVRAGDLRYTWPQVVQKRKGFRCFECLSDLGQHTHSGVCASPQKGGKGIMVMEVAKVY